MPTPTSTPMAAVSQIDAAVVRPRTDRPSLKITPAPRKPMPVMMPWAMRVGSTRATSALDAMNQRSWYRVTSISRLDARQTSVWVRKPAGRPWKLRSRPIKPPASTAISRCSVVSR